jgi:hypothetical protein
MEMPVTGGICSNCNQPRSEHSKKHGRCPTWAAKRPSTFAESKTEPAAVPGNAPGPPVDDDASDLALHGNGAVTGETMAGTDLSDDPDGVSPVPDEDDREAVDDDEVDHSPGADADEDDDETEDDETAEDTDDESNDIL